MAKIKIKASKQALKEREEQADFVDAPPGWYVVELISIEQKDAKKSGAPQLECVWRPRGIGKHKKPLPENYSQMWDYVQLEGEETEWKRAEFCLALGLTAPKKGDFPEIETDPKKPGTSIGTLALGKVKADANLNGDYRAKLGNLRPWDPSEAAEGDDGDDGEEWTKKTLKALDEADLKKVAKEFGVKVKGKDPKDVVKEVLAAQNPV